MGTAVGTSLFNDHGWRASAAANLGWQTFALFMLLVRGPHVSRYTWIGWEGGFSWRKDGAKPRDIEARTQPQVVDEKSEKRELQTQEAVPPVLGQGGEKEVTESPKPDDETAVTS